MDCSPPGSSVHGVLQEYWNGLPCPPPGDLPDPGIEPGSPALQEDSFPAEPEGKPAMCHGRVFIDLNRTATSEVRTAVVLRVSLGKEWHRQIEKEVHSHEATT